MRRAARTPGPSGRASRRRGPPSRPASPARVLAAVGLAAAVLLLSIAGVARPAHAQESEAEAVGTPGEPVSVDSARTLREAMERPPGDYPFDGYDALALPLRIVAFPVALVGWGAREAIAVLLAEGRGPDPISQARRQLDRWGIHPGFRGIGPRSGPAVGVRADPFPPLFLSTAVSWRGSQRHALGVETAGTTGDDLTAYAAGSDVRGARGAVEFRRWAEPYFWGVGPDSPAAAARDYLWDRVSVTGALRGAANPLGLRVAVGLEDNRVDGGFDDERPDLPSAAPADTLFGAGGRTRFARAHAAAVLDRTRWRALQPRGWRLEAGGTLFRGVDGTDTDFLRFSGAATGFLPLNERQQLALHAFGRLQRPQDGRGIPFTHLASVGGDRGLRGFDTDRFRGRDAVALMAEWRFEVWRTIHYDGRVEGFAFADAGTVGGRGAPLALDDLRSSFGFGLRAVGLEGVIALAYLGFSDEGTRPSLGFSWPY